MNGRLISLERLSASDLDRMFQLFGRHFEGVTERRFREDLEEKDWVIWLEDEAGRLVGFSTLLLYRAHRDGEPVTVVYSGDTVVDPRAWRSPVLARTWIESVWSLHRAFGKGRLYWLLIASGFRTYRFLPVFFREFFPRYDRATPEAIRRVMHRLARQRFGSRYDPATGIVRFEQPQMLKGSLRGISEIRMRDPHVAFFARANPDHGGGDELVCLAEVADRNLTPAARRIALARQPRREVGKAAAS